MKSMNSRMLCRVLASALQQQQTRVAYQHTSAPVVQEVIERIKELKPLGEQYRTSKSPSRLRPSSSPTRFTKRAGHESTQNRELFAKSCEDAGLKPVIGTIGGGNMAKAMIQGFIKADLLPTTSISVSEPMQKAREAIESIGVSTSEDNDQILSNAVGGIVILAVKPHILTQVVEKNGETLKKAGLIISILAGVTLKTLEKELGPNIPIVRVMPNTPALIGCAASVFSGNELCTDKHSAVVNELMCTVGTCHQVPESQVDAVTGLSGSGPAYVYTVIDAMSDGGVRMGLPRDLATSLAAQTVMGAAKMVLETNTHPAVLKNAVCSPGGTTIAGVHALEMSGVRGGVISAVEAAVKRANELGEEQ